MGDFAMPWSLLRIEHFVTQSLVICSFKNVLCTQEGSNAVKLGSEYVTHNSVSNILTIVK